MRSSRPDNSGALDSDKANVNSLSRHDTLFMVCSAKEIWVEVGHFIKKRFSSDVWKSLIDWRRATALDDVPSLRLADIPDAGVGVEICLNVSRKEDRRAERSYRLKITGEQYAS